MKQSMMRDEGRLGLIIWILLLLVGFGVCFLPVGALGDGSVPPAWEKLDLNRVGDILDNPPGRLPSRMELKSHLGSCAEPLAWEWDSVQAAVDRITHHLNGEDPEVPICRASALVLYQILTQLRVVLPQNVCAPVDEIEWGYPVLTLIGQMREQILKLVGEYPEDPAVFMALLAATALRVEGSAWFPGIDRQLALVPPHPAWARIWSSELARQMKGIQDPLLELAISERVRVMLPEKRFSDDQESNAVVQVPRRMGRELERQLLIQFSAYRLRHGRYPDEIFDASGGLVDWLRAALEGDALCWITAMPGFRLSGYTLQPSGCSCELIGVGFEYHRTIAAQD
ncbi:MAG: hypothetical protein KJ970_17775 [Candidatus Eisenbacteria bacterium]|uniref:Uncharacterized protein n=1 Tax=Eiseniibacteriota bacterium TaxID=2212470 RepID=A0A948W7Z2_UNCEI|nr:hypothetical protein [Candidatus Eisenbacteria bacterium]MBU1949938.1 hypothetical protein [Candidatus Eisenbacteria bacterium]MBU2692770.1 hypothetical protein [Candidatus Eisenbacteria bacterium]